MTMGLEELKLVLQAINLIAVVWLAIGIPTGLLATPWYTRMTPPTWWSYLVWVATAVMSGLFIADAVSPSVVSVPSIGSIP